MKPIDAKGVQRIVEIGRGIKARKFVVVIDLELHTSGIKPDSALAVAFVEAFAAADWTGYAERAGCKVASEETREVIRNVYRERAGGSR